MNRRPALDRYAARNANFVPVACGRIAVLAARSEARDTGNQPRGAEGISRGGAPWLVAAAAVLLLALGAAPIDAHHSFAAEFDRDRTITVTGQVTKLEWTNPHARLFVDGKDETGKQQVWDFELGPPNGLMRNGWSRNSLQPGHQVTVSGFRSKTSTVVANARTVKLADGRQVFAGSSFDTGAAQ